METNQLCSDHHVNTVTHLPAIYVSHLTHTHTITKKDNQNEQKFLQLGVHGT